MLVSEFDYELPPELIAQEPAPERSASRLLRLHASSGELEDLAFADLPSLVGARDALVLNDTRVIRARLAGRKRSGGKVEVFVERILAARAPGWPAPSGRKAAEVVSKYIVTDMYAKAVQGMPAEDAVKWAHAELVKVYG